MTRPDDRLLDDYQRRTRELAALYETAGDLSALRDVDEVLAAIVRRGRQLLGSDVAYLMLLDEAQGQAYMRVTEGTLTPEFLSIRLAFGEGIGGLVADTGMPQWTQDYPEDPRFAESINAIIRGESLTAILGVPLRVGRTVTGVLFAADRRARAFTHDEVALLSSLASHAAIALENASLFEESQQTLVKWRAATERIEEHNRTLERAAQLHEKLTELVLTGASLAAIADTVAGAIDGGVLVLRPDGTPLTPQGNLPELPVGPLLEALSSDGAGGSSEVTTAEGLTFRLAPAQAGSRRLGYLLHAGEPLGESDVRSLERAALVTALVLLDLRAHDEARSRVMGELFGELADLAERADPELAALRRRAEASGVQLPEPPYVAVVALATREPDPGGALGLEAVRLALSERGLCRTQGRQAAFILHGSDAAAAAAHVAQQLGGEAEAVTAGGVGPFGSLVEAAGALPRARKCAKVLATLGQDGRGTTPEQLGVYTLLFSEAGRDQIEGFVTETLGPVVQHDAARGGRLMQTLEAYFDVGGQTGKLAEALYVHVNTLYQRLERLDRLLGADWRRGERSLQVHLALRLALLLRQTQTPSAP